MLEWWPRVNLPLHVYAMITPALGGCNAMKHKSKYAAILSSPVAECMGTKMDK